MDIAVDRPAYERLARALGGGESGRDGGIRRLTVLNPHPRGPDEHAWLRRDPDGTCVCLDADHLCRLQKDFGDDVLSDTCAVYPRMLVRTPGGLELFGSLSCPEAARLCLTGEGALDLVEIPADQIPRLSGTRFGAALRSADTDPQRETREMIRAFALDALADESFPFETRLCWMVHMADRLEPLLSPAHDGPGPAGPEIIGEELRQLAALAERSAIHAWRLRKAIPAAPAIGLLLSVQQTLSDGTQSARLARTVRAGFEALGGGDCETMAVAYQARRERLSAHFGEEVDRYLMRYSAYTWLTDFGGQPARLGSYVLRWLSRLGHLRLLLVGHPQVTPLLEPTSGSDGGSGKVDRASARKTLESVVCAMTQLLVKEIEHRPVIRAAAESAVGAAEHGDLFGRSLLFVNV